jgi:hypothetical protein
MTIDPGKFAIASGISVAVLWIACSVLVWMSPVMMMSMTEHMLHADLSDMTWELTLSGVFAGLVVWTGLAAVTGGLIAGIYNRLTGLRAE